MRSEWLNYNHCVRLLPIAVTTIGLYLSVVLESYRLSRKCDCFEIDSPYYIIFVFRVVTLVAAVKLFSPLKISSNALQSLITKFRLKHLANVTVFYFAALYIFALIGVHEIGPLDYRCISNRIERNNNHTPELCWANVTVNDDGDDKNDTCIMCEDDMCDVDMNVSDSTCVSLDDLSVPDLHCQPCDESKPCNESNCNTCCPDGYSCRKVNIGRNYGYYGHYDNLGMFYKMCCSVCECMCIRVCCNADIIIHSGVSLLTVYEVSTLELWSFQSYTALYSGHNVQYYYITIIFLLVIIIQQSIFLVVIIESFADVRSDSNLIIRSKPQPRPDFVSCVKTIVRICVRLRGILLITLKLQTWNNLQSFSIASKVCTLRYASACKNHFY